MDDMDSSSSHTNNSSSNWLAFSLSNHSHLFPSGGILDQENGSCTRATAVADQRLAVLGGGCPKLEDFLGAAGISSGNEGSAADGFAGLSSMPGVDIYDDSELKTIAAGFLSGFSTDKSRHPATAAPVKKSVETFGQRTSIFRGVTRHRWTGRYEAHLWDNSCRREGQSRKGRQVYLGGYDKEEKAARAYDLAALKYWGPTTTTNFPASDYEKEMEEMKHMTRQEFVASLRRRSSGFSRGASIYRGVTRHHQHGRWQARIGRVAGNKDLYLGTFSTQEEAAEAYDIAAIKFRGLNAVTNFDMSRYDVKSIASSNLPIGGANAVNKSKTSSESDSKSDGLPSSSEVVQNKDLASSTSLHFLSQNSSTPTITFSGLPMKPEQPPNHLWAAALGYQTPAGAAVATNPMFPDASATPYCVDFPAGRSHDQNFLAGYVYYQQQQSSSNGTTPQSPSAAVVCTNGTSREAHVGIVGNNNNNSNSNSNSSNSWINAQQAPSPSTGHTFQGPKASLSAFQTPIFGVE
ncbi:AP2-like ethylene-responsive transcription factor AIL5 [Andrographis paniculata]|uniref:AP2-like ethylene-responsive transcription factor AIL5 n=1 Tax=Andrographis paniculata TaxID=175694 RepID=UPI0021E6FED3|nr:AP2-like ethylene-responsive transcription factor AIL5 [Andrographis paniculata]